MSVVPLTLHGRIPTFRPDMSAERYRHLAYAAGVVATVLGCTALFGQLLDVQLLKQLLPGFGTIKLNSAAALALVGMSLLLQIEPDSPAQRKWMGRAFACSAFAIAFLTLLQHALGVELGIDQLLCVGEPGSAHPGRMSPNAAVSYVAVGTALVLLDTKVAALRATREALAIAVFAIGFIAATGYALGVTSLYGISGHASMAFHTMLGLLALSMGVLASRPKSAVMAILAQSNPAGTSIRRLLPLIVLVPVGVGWLGLQGHQRGMFATDFVLALTVTIFTGAIATLAVWNARLQGKSERARQQGLEDERFLFELGDLLRTSVVASDVLFAVSKKLGEYLGVSRCLFAEVDVPHDQVTIVHDYHHGLTSMAGTHVLSSYGSEVVAEASAGHTVVVSNTSDDKRTTPYHTNAYEPAGLGALVAMPLLREGRWVSNFVVAGHEPRVWQARELSLIRSVAEGAWLWFEGLGLSEAVRKGDEERSRAEQETRVSEERFWLFVHAVKDHAIFLLDADGTVATWNAGAQRLEGYCGDEIVGRNFSTFFSREDIEAGKPQQLLELATRKGTHQDEGWRVRKNGSRVWCSVVLTALRDAKGELVGFGKVTHDMTERLRANERFRLAIEAAPTGMLMIDRAGKIVLANLHVEKMFGYKREALLAKSTELLVPERFRGQDPEHRADFFRTPEAHVMGKGRQLYALRQDGTEVPVEIGLTPLETPEGNFVLCSVVDVTERRRGEREREDLVAQLLALNTDLEARVTVRTSELSASLRERETLLQEVHHRVKNNLQVISSLINMQVRKLTDVASRSALDECQARVQAIALIHEKLYQSKDYSRVPFSEYASSLAASVFHATGVSPGAVSLELDIEVLSLAVDKAIPCGLILNELITNALKHAFPAERVGVIRVELHRLPDAAIRISVADDGVGMPAKFDIEKSSSLGMQLVSTLVEQLEGRLEVSGASGAKFSVTFSEEG